MDVQNKFDDSIISKSGWSKNKQELRKFWVETSALNFDEKVSKMSESR